MKPRILLTGATGYVGGELLKALLAAAYPMRCLARRPEVLRAKGLSGVEVVAGDVLDAASVRSAMAGVDTAYYLVHSMGSTESFEEQDRTAAQNFAVAAREAGVRRIIYLGGLGHSVEKLSAHLRSRHEVGEVLRSTGVPVVEFRASVVIGSGSLSFEMIRALVERLPVMIAPRWVSVAAQPIAVADLLSYLLAALDLPLDGNRIFEIGGSDQVSYGGLMKEYAKQRGLKRLVISVPLLTPRLSSLWLGLVTPLYVRVGRKLIDSICHPTIVEDQTALEQFKIRPCGYREAIAAALNTDGRHLMIDSRTIHVTVSPQDAFAPIRRIGGDRGWYYANWLWQLRGLLDGLFGGVGLRRGRRDPDSLRVGDPVDFWRVEAIEPNRRLRLAAEMKLPGRAWLEFEVAGDSTGSVIRQTATFDPKGLLGRAYWYSVFPLHQFVFGGMLQTIAARAKSRAERMPIFLKSILVDAPVETVFDFHEREDALRLLSPRFPPLRVIRKTGGIEPGSRVELKIGPFLWTALHTAYEKNRLFTDEQVQGPFAKWVHRHEFESVDRATRLTDRVEYRLPGGIWVNRLFGWAVQLGLHQMFRRRHQMTKLYCERGPK